MTAFNAFFEKIGSSVIMRPEILAFGSLCSVNFHPILDYVIPNLKLNYEDSENIKTNRVNTVVFNLRQIKKRNFLGNTCYMSLYDTYPTGVHISFENPLSSDLAIEDSIKST